MFWIKLRPENQWFVLKTNYLRIHPPTMKSFVLKTNRVMPMVLQNQTCARAYGRVCVRLCKCDVFVHVCVFQRATKCLIVYFAFCNLMNIRARVCFVFFFNAMLMFTAFKCKCFVSASGRVFFHLCYVLIYNGAPRAMSKQYHKA